MGDGNKRSVYLLAKFSNFLLDGDHVHSLDIADNRSDETLLGSNSHTDVDVVSINNRVGILDTRVYGGKIPHSQYAGT